MFVPPAFQLDAKALVEDLATVLDVSFPAPRFCRRHHQIKQLPGWEIAQGDYAELTFTTPTGRRYRTHPPNPDGDEPPDEEL